jgi:Tol biopolymer transport system component
MKWPRLSLILILLLLLILVASTDCGSGRKEGNGLGRKDSYGPALSGNGRYVAFVSYDPALRDLLKIDCPEELCWQVYVRDVQTGDITLASSDSEGKPARTAGAVVDPHGYPYGGGTSSPFGKGPTQVSISDDGRYVVFSSYALNSSGEAALFRKDMQSGELSSVSAPPAAPQNLATFFLPAMSGDGRFIAYWTYSPALFQGGEGAKLYVRDMTAAQSEVIPLDGLPGGKDVGLPDTPNAVTISDDGRFVAFAASLSGSSGLQSEGQRVDVTPSGIATSPITGSGLQPGIFMTDRQTGELRAISTSSSGENANGPSYSASISGDGRFAVFGSGASNLVSEPTCVKITASCSNVYLKNLQSGETKLLSKNESGAAMNNAGSPVISKDGGAVAFVTLKAIPPTSLTEPTTSTPPVQETIYRINLKSGDMIPVTPELRDGQKETGVTSVPKYNLRGPVTRDGAGQVLRVSSALAGYHGISISADGRFVAFPALSSWLGMEDRMCTFRISRKREVPHWLDTSPPDPCIEIFLKDVTNGELSRLSSSS